jgi:hypothetical protein
VDDHPTAEHIEALRDLASGGRVLELGPLEIDLVAWGLVRWDGGARAVSGMWRTERPSTYRLARAGEVALEMIDLQPLDGTAPPSEQATPGA